MGKGESGAGERKAYYKFIDANQPGAQWQVKDNITLGHPKIQDYHIRHTWK